MTIWSPSPSFLMYDCDMDYLIQHLSLSFFLSIFKWRVGFPRLLSICLLSGCAGSSLWHTGSLLQRAGLSCGAGAQ